MPHLVTIWFLCFFITTFTSKFLHLFSTFSLKMVLDSHEDKDSLYEELEHPSSLWDCLSQCRIFSLNKIPLFERVRLLRQFERLTLLEGWVSFKYAQQTACLLNMHNKITMSNPNFHSNHALNEGRCQPKKKRRQPPISKSILHRQHF